MLARVGDGKAAIALHLEGGSSIRILQHGKCLIGMRCLLDGFLHLGGKLVFQVTAWLEAIYIYRHIIEQVRSEAVERLDRF